MIIQVSLTPALPTNGAPVVYTNAQPMMFHKPLRPSVLFFKAGSEISSY